MTSEQIKQILDENFTCPCGCGRLNIKLYDEWIDEIEGCIKAAYNLGILEKDKDIAELEAERDQAIATIKKIQENAEETNKVLHQIMDSLNKELNQ